MASETLVEALKKAEVPSDEAFDALARRFRNNVETSVFTVGSDAIREVIAADADTLLPILAAHASPAAKREALRVLIGERLDEISDEHGDVTILGMSPYADRYAPYAAASALLSVLVPDPVEVSE